MSPKIKNQAAVSVNQILQRVTMMQKYKPSFVNRFEGRPSWVDPLI